MASRDFIYANEVDGLRNLGHDLESAVADLVDNSIDAKAKNIVVGFARSAKMQSQGEYTAIYILDDGQGMDQKEIYEAMSFGKKDGTENQSLGKFGVGLKYASFAFCRRLVVASKKNGFIHIYVWDLRNIQKTDKDNIIKLEHLKYDLVQPHTKKIIDMLLNQDSGTAVIWEDIDRLINEENLPTEYLHLHFNKNINTVKQHLGMVFNRYIGKEDSKLKIYCPFKLDKYEVKPWDPCFTKSKNVSKEIDEIIQLDNSKIRVQGFLFPDTRNLEPEQVEYIGGPKGWFAHQGFHVYRNNRLIIDGDWLDLGTHKPLKKQTNSIFARLQIDFESKIDDRWQVNAQKTKIYPPKAIYPDLTEIATKLRSLSSGKRKRRYSGTYKHAEKNEVLSTPWDIKVIDGYERAILDKQHNIFINFKKYNKFDLESFEIMLQEIEEYFPYSIIAQNKTSDVKVEHEYDKDFLNILFRKIDDLVNLGLSLEAAKCTILKEEIASNYLSEIISYQKI